MTRTKSVFTGIGIVILSFVIIGAMMASKPKPPKKPVNNVAPMVEVFTHRVEPVTFEVKAHGVVMPRTETTLVSEVSGVVESVSDKFVAGGYFTKGEVLLQIDPTEYRVGVEQAKARLASQKAKYLQEKAKAEQAEKEWALTGRSKDTAPVLALRKPFMLEAEANMQSAEADLKKAEQKLARTVIRAPYDGMVKEKKSDVGQYVATGTQLGITFAIDYAEVRLPLTDHDLAFINVPNWSSNSNVSPVSISADYAGKTHQWKGELVRMEGAVDQQSRVHYAVVKVSDPYGVFEENRELPPLKVGTFVTANIRGKEESGLIKLPREAFKDLTQVVVSDQDKKLQIRELEVVRAEADFVYIRGGLNDGDRIVMTSIQSPVKGMSLRISGEEESPIKSDEKGMLAEKTVADKE